MKDMQAEMTRNKEEDQRTLRAGIDKLTTLIMKLVARLPKKKGPESQQVCFEKDNKESNDEPRQAPALMCLSKFKIGKAYKPGMKYNHKWDVKTKEAWKAAKSKWNQANPKNIQS